MLCLTIGRSCKLICNRIFTVSGFKNLTGESKRFQKISFENVAYLHVNLFFLVGIFFSVVVSSEKSYAGNALSLTLTTTNVTCHGLNNGTVTSVLAGASGGTVNYTLTPGSISNTIGVFTNLVAGVYTVNADDGGIIATASITLTEPVVALSSAIISQTNVLCKGNTTGSVTVAGSGGTAGYTYSKDGGTMYQASGTFNSLIAGLYSIRVKDGNGCTIDQPVSIAEPAVSLSVVASSDTPVCSNSTLNLSASGSGGTAPYTYSWNGPNSFTSTNQSPTIVSPTAAAAGNYTVTVKDANNCTATIGVTVTVYSAPIVTVNASISSICAGGPVTLSSTSDIPPSSAIVLLTENFNGSATGWTTINNSSGGTPGNAAWTKRADNYAVGGTNLSSNDNSSFYLSDSRTQNGTKTETYLKSTSVNTTGFSSLSLSFWQYFRYENVSNEAAKVQVSTNGTSWTDIDTFTAGQGTSTSFKNSTYDLSAYINQSTLYIRFFYYSDQRARYWAIDNLKLSGTTLSATPNISWSSNPAGFSSTLSNPPTANPNVTTTYTATYTNSATNCSSSASTTVTVNPKPNVTIQPNYCAVPGHIRLTAGGGTTYLWSTGETTNPIMVDIANTFTVTSTNAFGCTGSASLPVSTELVTNGDFSAGNTGITSAYGYVSTGYTGVSTTGLWPEGYYAIGSDPTFYHPNFWGRDHTTNSGNFMIVNGSGSNPPVVAWQQTVSVLPNTDYYFAAWAISLNSVSPYANLQFSVNGVLVGTTAPLTARAGNNNPPYNWQRFYGNWNSGIATTAIIQVVDLQTALGGNDFGLDDISFGTLAAIPFTITPTVNPTATACSGKTMYLKANLTGGRSPITYSWTGPNGFTSTLKDPIIPNVSVTHSGIYTLSVVDGYGCTPVTGSTNATILPSPNPLISSISGSGNVCPSSQDKYWTPSQSNVTNSWTVTGGNIVGSSVKDSVEIKWAASGNGLITLKSTNTVNLCDSTITKSVIFQDLIPPDFLAPTPSSFCVEDLISAAMVSNLLQINPTPDYFLFKRGSNTLDVNPASFSDNCTPADQLVLHWKIDFSGTTPPPSISGTGQPSAYVSDIIFPGDGASFLDVIHSITYWVVDLTGNESVHKTVTITIHPRPAVSYNNQNNFFDANKTNTKTLRYETNT